MLPADVIWHGNPTLIPFLVNINKLKEDEFNANTHPDRSIDEIAGSYVRFGQQKPLVSDSSGLVKDGNGQLVAATGLGWTHIAVLPSNLDGHELTAYALASNRTAESSQWDFEALAKQLTELDSAGIETEDLGWEPDELGPLLAMGYQADGGRSVTSPGSEPRDVQFKAYDETVADEVKYHECPECHHRWPA